MQLTPLKELIDLSNQNNMAYIEASRIHKLTAFNLKYNPKRKIVNKDCINYTFMDRSILKINKTNRTYTVINPLGKKQMTGNLFNY